jgi:YgiT-type zinc finger domain-containing protein
METQENPTIITPAPVSEYRCPECAAGLRRLHHLTYLTWFRDQLITVPNFPAWVCDICGRRDYDTRAVSWLKTILHTHKGRRFNRRSAYT